MKLVPQEPRPLCPAWSPAQAEPLGVTEPLWEHTVCSGPAVPRLPLAGPQHLDAPSRKDALSGGVAGGHSPGVPCPCQRSCSVPTPEQGSACHLRGQGSLRGPGVSVAEVWRGSEVSWGLPRAHTQAPWGQLPSQGLSSKAPRPSEGGRNSAFGIGWLEGQAPLSLGDEGPQH